MTKRKDKTAEKIKQLYEHSKTDNRVQWEYINQKGYDFAHDNQKIIHHFLQYILHLDFPNNN